MEHTYFIYGRCDNEQRASCTAVSANNLVNTIDALLKGHDAVVVMPLQEEKRFWVCGEQYRGSGRLSRTWIEEAIESPDTEQECSPSCMIYNQRGSGSCGPNGCIPYPFNGMGGFVDSGHETRESAETREAELWDEAEWPTHDNCHSPSRPDWQCQYCQEAGWVE